MTFIKFFPVNIMCIMEPIVLLRKPYRFSDLVDISIFSGVMETFFGATGISNGVAEADGELLLSFGWTDAYDGKIAFGNRRDGLTDRTDGLVGTVLDITERQRLEEALAESRTRYRQIFDNMQEGLFLLEVSAARRFRVIESNPAFERIIGIPRDAMIGQLIDDILLPETAQKVSAKYNRCIDSGEVYHEEQELQLPVGLHTYHTTLVPVRGEGGRIVRLVGISRDITDRKRAEIDTRAQYDQIVCLNKRLMEDTRILEEQAQELEASQEQIKRTEVWYREVLHSAPDGMLVIDELSNIVMANAQLCRMFGYDEWEIVGQSIGLLLPIDGLSGAGEKRNGDLRVFRKDRSGFSADISLSRLSDSDIGVGMMCIAIRDTTDRKRMEQHLKEALEFSESIINAMPDLLLEMNQQGRCLNVWTGYSGVIEMEKEALLGRTVHEVLSPDNASIMMAAIREAQEKGVSHENVIRIECPDGSVRWFDRSVTRKYIDDPGDTRFIVLSRDITEQKRAEDKLREREAFLDLLINTIPIPVFYNDREGRYLGCNKAYEEFFGSTRERLIGKTVFDIHPKELAEFYFAHDTKLCELGGRDQYESKVVDVQGFPRDTICYHAVFLGRNGEPGGVIGAILDITDRKRMEEDISTREHDMRTLLENSPDRIVRFDRDCRCLYANPAFASAGGAVSLIGKKPSEFPADANSAVLEEKLCNVIASGFPSQFELNWLEPGSKERCTLVSLTPELDDKGEVSSVLSVGRDITELNDYRKRIAQLAFYDGLTSLPNRTLFNDRIKQVLADSAWHKQLTGLMLIDMDEFKAVNDTLGHNAGDILLSETAKRLSACIRAYDTVARLGGDEFAVILPDIRQGDDLGMIARKLLRSFDTPFLLEGREVFVTCSIGIAMFPTDGDSAEDLLKYADSAMYLAKRSGRNNFRFYSRSLTDSAEERLLLENDLRKGMARGELELYYQPKVDLESGRLIGSEALLRWRHPERGMIAPDRFIGIAEDSGLIIPIGEWVLREAFRTARAWNAEGMPPHRVAVNLSARQFLSNDIVKTVLSAMDECGCRAEYIELEITESMLIDKEGEVLSALEALHSLGLSIAIDDFGTGYSSLSYLARFPISTLKIDRSFISKINSGDFQAELVKAIISIARILHQDVVAEGVESRDQADFLRSHGCHFGQGYLYSKPIPKDAFESLPRSFE